MLKLLQPDLYVRSLRDIPLAALKVRGIRGLIIDLDNTVTEWGRATLDVEVYRWFAELKDQGLKACLVSNNRSSRVQKVATALGIPAISRAGKPRRRAFYQAMAVMDTGVGSTAVIGDQVFTDVLGGNRLGLYTVLVMPINRREFIGTRMMRQVEKLITRCLVISEFNSNERNP
ncbi:HAD-superfamily hydrolase,subfamily IIIA [Moorella glycerini]|uniref:Mitochondrial PGP phosphatase n=1 Tax=Neomoorella stamsii TaxID=1266720 RepID=A0A9X7P7S4_9FIRM|nr:MULTISPECIES: YqeG family HAD IIIA-type phosphatase [Moorella]PRR77757.1 Mitochondrial PGP phosphatase [Moorella stamsii]CEP66026.1 HAD-superfamily hydrolase,subfamily IIIA [Moorella glycerini]